MMKNMNITTKKTRETPAIYPFERQKTSYYVMTCLDNIFVYKFCNPSTLRWGSQYHKCTSEVSHFLLSKCSACQQLFCKKNFFSAQLSIPICADRLRYKLFVSPLSNVA